MSYVSHDGLAYFKHKLDQKFISNITSENGALKIILGDGTVLKNIQDTTVTQKKSTANELYPLLLCYDAMADQDQLSKETWFGQHILANPYYGYLAARGMYVKHPTFNRRNGVSQKVEWAYDFTDAVSGLGNPMSQVYAYVDPASEGGEHCIELRLYGNPNVSPTIPSINDSTNTFSIGVGVTGGNVQFGYCPSTPLYLDNGSTLRTEATGHGNDIITRDWLNLNGSFTGLVHTTMNETIDGAKTFKKTVTINSGDNNNKAGLYIQGNSDVHGNEHVYGTETVDGKLTANGTAEIKGGSGNTPSLTVTGSEYVSGNSNIHGNMDVDGNSNTDGNQTVGGTSTITGKLTANGTAEIKGGSGNNSSLTVTGNETVTGNSSVGGNSSIAGSETVTGKITGNGGAEISGGSGLKVNGNETVTGNITTNGTITKVVNNTPVEYVTYVTNQPAIREEISQNLLSLGKGLAKDSNGKIYVDFSQIDNNVKAEILAGLNMQIPLKSSITLYVNPGANNDTDSFNLSFTDRVATPFTTISKAVEWASSKLALGTRYVTISVYAGTYKESVSLPEVNSSSGYITIRSNSGNKDVLIEPPLNSNGVPYNAMYANKGACHWSLEHLRFKLNLGNNTGLAGDVTCCLSAATSGARIDVHGCDFIATPSVSSFSSSSYTIRMIEVEAGGYIYLYPDSKGSSFTFNRPNIEGTSLYPLHVSRGGTLYYVQSNSGSGAYTCNGTCTTFLYEWQNGAINNMGYLGEKITFPVASGGSVTGRQYNVRTGSYALIPPGGYPGTEEGLVDASTYAWIANL